MNPADVLKKLREAHNLTQEELAARVLVTRQAVSRWENGETQPSADTLRLLVEWQKPSLNGYVLGLEPTNGSLNGCEYDRTHGFGATLPPGGAVEYECFLEFERV